MELSTIDMPRDEALEALVHYKEAVRTDRRDEDRRIAAGLRAIIAGHALIKLPESIARGGWFDNGLPRIAIARADAKHCLVRRTGRYGNAWEFVYSDIEGADNRGALVGEHTVRVRVPEAPDNRTAWRGRTIVPLIPPQHRRAGGRGGMSNLHVLWEVEAWDLTPPVDPALIKWVGGDLWAVLATWDLTELERAVLAGRAVP
jgi:hypothetical protein